VIRRLPLGNHLNLCGLNQDIFVIQVMKVAVKREKKRGEKEILICNIIYFILNN